MQAPRRQTMKDSAMEDHKKLFWLHIRKSAGTSIVTRFPENAYKRVDRHMQPRCFIQSPKEDWNDIVNNFRVVLGEYTFRRALFAKTYLYKDEWDSFLSFAFSRNPLDRCLSMFYYVFWRNNELGARLLDSIRIYRATNKFSLLDSYTFDIFLDVLEERFFGDRDSIFQPMNLHFMTHTARMSEDIYDENGKILLTRIYRMECLDAAVEEVLADLGQQPAPIAEGQRAMNKSKQKRFTPSKSQIRKVERLYQDDFDIYENALVR